MRAFVARMGNLRVLLIAALLLAAATDASADHKKKLRFVRTVRFESCAPRYFRVPVYYVDDPFDSWGCPPYYRQRVVYPVYRSRPGLTIILRL